MDWLAGHLWAALIGSYVPAYRDVPATASELDLLLIQLVYGFVASRTTCARCGDPLGRALHIEAWPGTATSPWQVLVATQCSSWRRHRLTAVVTEVSGCLRLGSFASARRAT
jgi:hypothetical protein